MTGKSGESVFHVLLWTIDNSDRNGPPLLDIAAGATFGSRADANRIAEWFRAGLVAGYIRVNGSAELAYHSRVGVVEIPKADPRLGHPAPYTSAEVDVWIATGKQSRD